MRQLAAEEMYLPLREEEYLILGMRCGGILFICGWLPWFNDAALHWE